MLTQAEIAVYRRTLEDIYTLAERDTRSVVLALRDQPVPVAAGELREVLPVVAESYGAVATLVAGEFFVEQQRVAGLPQITDFRQPDYDFNTVVQTGVGYSIARLTQGTPFESAAGLLYGAVQKAVAGFARETIKQNSSSVDVEYRRVARPNACAFCAYAAVQEILTESEQRFHNDCHCTFVPVFGEFQEPDYYEEFRRQDREAYESLSERRNQFEANFRREFPTARGSDLTKAASKEGLALTAKNRLAEIRKITDRS